MAANAWGKPGAWALDLEEHEDELEQEKPATPMNGNGQSAAGVMTDFPDLMTAAATKTKKKKGQTLSLGEFVTGSTNKPKAQTYQAAKGLTAEDMMMLPTGPRERTAEELDRSRLGGGFRSYGDRGNDSSNSRWGSSRSSGGVDEGRKSREPLGPSRADEIDDWGAGKKSAVGGGGFSRKERGGGFFEGSDSRADESDRWVSNKKETPSEGRRNVRFETGGGADNSDNWGKKKEEEVRRSAGGGGGGAFASLRERRGGNESSDSDNWGRKSEEPSGGGSMTRPKLNLQPRKLPVGDGDEAAAAAAMAAAAKRNKGLSPFGDARPREQVLKEKGQDWKEIDEKLESMKVKESGSGEETKRGFRAAQSNNDPPEGSWRKSEAAVALHPQSVENDEDGGADDGPEEKDAAM